MTDAVRAPDELLEGLPDFPFESHYRQWDGLRLAHLDEGDGAPVVFFHGEPTWSYLWRKVLVAGARRRLSLHRAGPPGLRPLGQAGGARLVQLRPPRRGDWRRWSRSSTCAARPRSCTTGAARSACGWRSSTADRFDRIVILDTGLFTGQQPMSEAWIAFRDFVERTEDLPVGFLVRGACKQDPGDAVIAAYDAPVPERRLQGRRPGVPAAAPDLAGDARQRPPASGCWRGCARTTRPKLVLWADSRSGAAAEHGRAVRRRARAPRSTT